MSQIQIDVNGSQAILHHAARRAENVTWRGRPALMLDGLALDDQVLYEGEHLYEKSLGYVSLDHMMECPLSPGEHTLAVTLSRTEFFGWGMIMALEGPGVRLNPAAVG